MRDADGQIVGAYHAGSKTVLLTPDAGTVLHEIGWHAMYDWAKANAPELYRQMRRFALEAPEEVQAWVKERYGRFSAEGLLDEIGAKLFTDQGREEFENAVKSRASRRWYQRLADFFRELWGRFTGAHRADLGAYRDLTPEAAMKRLLSDILAGKRFGKQGGVRSEERGAGRGDMLVRFAKGLGVSPEQLQAEYDAVAKRYAEKLAEMRKAWNGEDAELNERRWVLVRTPRFKAWFGNWEMNLDDRLKPVRVDGQIFGGNWKTAQQWLLDPAHNVLEKVAKNRDTGMEIFIPRKVLNHESISGPALGKSVNAIGHYEVLRALPRLLEAASLIGAEAQRKNDRTKLGVYRFVVPVRVEDTNGKIEKDGKKWTDYAVKLTVIEHAPGHHPGTVGNQFYTHELANIIVEMPGENAATGNNEYPLRTAVPGTPIDYRIGNLLGSVNIGRSGKTRWKIPEASKVVDANGEPLVVYHATDNDFTVFDRGRLGEFTDQNATDEVASQMARLGFWFSDHDIRKQTAQDNVKAVWLNIKNPYQTSFEELWEVLEGQTAEEFIAGLEKEGFDGIILDDTEFGGKSFVAFKSNQAKSATDNTGAFDPANPDILYSKKRGENPAKYYSKADATTRQVLPELLKLAEGKDGTIENSKLGSILYPLGKSGSSGLGFLHIVEQRIREDAPNYSLERAVDIAVAVAASAKAGRISTENLRAWGLEKDGVRAIISKTADGQPIITGYAVNRTGNKKSAGESGGTVSQPPVYLSDPDELRSRAVAALKKRIQQLQKEFNAQDEQAKQEDDGLRYSFAGERGAAALDQAEEATTRLDNLAIAREMEEAGKDAKTVKLATGWERGKDGIRYVQAFQRRGERSIVNVMIFVT